MNKAIEHPNGYPKQIVLDSTNADWSAISEEERSIRTELQPREGSVEVPAELLVAGEDSGDYFGMVQNAGMDQKPTRAHLPNYGIFTTLSGHNQGSDDDSDRALGFHTGSFAIPYLLTAAIRTLSSLGKLPFHSATSDPCDGRTQGNHGGPHSMVWRNLASETFFSQMRSLPMVKALMVIGGCDKGLPALMMALAMASRQMRIPGIVVPTGVSIPVADAEDTGHVQSQIERQGHGSNAEQAGRQACISCGTSGGSCHFLRHSRNGANTRRRAWSGFAPYCACAV